ncbi:Uncharacterised protein [Vibrio cholerae]|nr:Uncharacterised protein [Vibrio cholerae]CSB82705.1 Uncharacterised protein [Vibrio cholerae]
MAADTRNKLTNHWIINTQNRLAVKRQIVQKVDKGLFKVFKIAAVSIHMIRFDIGDNGDHRLQMQE